MKRGRRKTAKRRSRADRAAHAYRRMECGAALSSEDDLVCCPRCGSSCSFEECTECDEFGYAYHDCGEDCCMCLDQSNNVTCAICRGKGGWWQCLSSAEWCKANPIAGREQTERTC